MTPDPVDRSAAFPTRPHQRRLVGRSSIHHGYVVEESLSVDNVFVIAMLFQYFAVPR
jgi:predicted tellurium resistance membrane protein TerC